MGSENYQLLKFSNLKLGIGDAWAGQRRANGDPSGFVKYKLSDSKLIFGLAPPIGSATRREP